MYGYVNDRSRADGNGGGKATRDSLMLMVTGKRACGFGKGRGVFEDNPDCCIFTENDFNCRGPLKEGTETLQKRLCSGPWIPEVPE